MKLRLALVAFFAMTTVLITSCGKDKAGYWDQDMQNEADRQLIDEYVAENNLEGSFTQSGLYYVIADTGGVDKPTSSAKISVHYKGNYLDGTILDEGNLSDTYLSNLIAGWQEGIKLIGKNGKIKLIIPSYLGYGHTPQNGVRADAVIVFDIELIDFSN